jgi:uncharacterized membrane protein
MDLFPSLDRIQFLFSRFRERLWVRPLAVCLLSVGAAFGAKLADGTWLADIVPTMAPDGVEKLLSVMASSLLVIATFSVGSMVSAYASASNTATPRSFALVVADDASQNALSTFVGGFIYSLVALMAVKNNYFEKAGIFILFLISVFVFGMVIATFVRWVDRIARLGRMGSTIEKVEKATAQALLKRRNSPTLGGLPLRAAPAGEPLFAGQVGYVQHINIAALQTCANELDIHILVTALPGTLATPGQPLAFAYNERATEPEIDYAPIIAAFQIGKERLFSDDPRFGLIVLAEIAARALSPAVNDPGTAICVIGSFIRLFALWGDQTDRSKAHTQTFDRVAVPELSIDDMFDDAFTPIGRDGAHIVEVAVRLQKALRALASTGNEKLSRAAKRHACLALKRSQLAMQLEEDRIVVHEAAIDGESLSLKE